jgi:hypothetical protein
MFVRGFEHFQVVICEVLKLFVSLHFLMKEFPV